MNPAGVYENLTDPFLKKQVKSDIKPLAGVYIILNLINGNTYVGSAITGRMPLRFHKHLDSLNGSKLVKAAVLKYGLQNFAFIIAEIMPEVVKLENNRELLNMENSYLQRLLPKYNIALTAGNTLGYKHSEDTKRKMGLIYSTERKEKIGALNRDKSLAKETIEKMRASALARRPLSAYSRALISANSPKAYN